MKYCIFENNGIGATLDTRICSIKNSNFINNTGLAFSRKTRLYYENQNEIDYCYLKGNNGFGNIDLIGKNGEQFTSDEDNFGNFLDSPDNNAGSKWIKF